MTEFENSAFGTVFIPIFSYESTLSFHTLLSYQVFNTNPNHPNEKGLGPYAVSGRDTVVAGRGGKSTRSAKAGSREWTAGVRALASNAGVTLQCQPVPPLAFARTSVESSTRNLQAPPAAPVQKPLQFSYLFHTFCAISWPGSGPGPQNCTEGMK